MACLKWNQIKEIEGQAGLLKFFKSSVKSHKKEIFTYWNNRTHNSSSFPERRNLYSNRFELDTHAQSHLLCIYVTFGALFEPRLRYCFEPLETSCPHIYQGNSRVISGCLSRKYTRPGAPDPKFHETEAPSVIVIINVAVVSD